MSTANVVIGVVIGVVFGSMLIAFHRRYSDVVSVLVVLGIVALAVVVTIYRVDQYWAQQAAIGPITQSQPLAMSGSSVGPSGGPAGLTPVARLPMMRGMTGAAAPPAAQSPYAGESR